MSIARELAGRLGLRRVGREWRGRCPACGYPTGLTLSEQGGRVLWWCASCRDQEAVTAALWGDGTVLPETSLAAPNIDTEREKRAAAARIWDGALAAPGTLVEVYLASRGLTMPPGAPLRLLPSAKHPGGVRLPAMLALVVNCAGEPMAVHRTFLARDGSGKATVEPSRMTFGPVRGGAIRLHVAGETLVVAEGIETALAAAVLLKVPAWAAVSAGNLRERLVLPDTIRDIIIAADHDQPGLAAAAGAAARFRREGRRVRIAVPDRKGQDFNDILRERAGRG